MFFDTNPVGYQCNELLLVCKQPRSFVVNIFCLAFILLLYVLLNLLLILKNGLTRILVVLVKRDNLCDGRFIGNICVIA